MFGRKTCEVVMIIDRSGSMSSCKKEIIEGMNKFVAEQKKLPGRCNMTSVIFDHEYTPCYESTNIQDLGFMGEDTYVPRGTTALYDAIGRTVEDCKARFATTKPDQVIVAIVTDGMENASKEFTRDQIANLIESLDGWQWVFLGANQDAVLSAQSISMPTDHVHTYDATPGGTREAMSVCCSNVSTMRSAGNTAISWDADAKAP